MTDATEAPQNGGTGLTLRALVVATALAILAGFWVKQAGMVGMAVQIDESVPVIPAVAVLILFMILNPLLARLHPRLALTRAEVLVVFAILSLTPILNSIGMMRMLLPMMISAKYYQTPENHLDVVWDRLPRWFGPRDEKLINDAFRGHQPNLPWEQWLPGLTVWFCFSLAIFIALLGLSTIFRKQWTERERLTFPLMQVVEELTPSQSTRILRIFKDPYFWMGASIPLVYNLVQMSHAFFPQIPSLGRGWNMGEGLVARPWNAMKPLEISYRPELVGLGYLMSTEVTFSIWFSYLLLRLSRVIGVMAVGMDPNAPFPYDQSQAMGAYIALALVSLYLGRQALRDVWRNTLSRRDGVDDRNEPMGYRTALLCVLGGLAFVLFVSLRAGMGWTLAGLYFFFVFAVALVYTRIRAETGAPMVWLIPFWQQEKMIYSLFGSSALMAGSDAQPLIVLASYTWISRGYFPNAAMSIQMESYKLADDSGTPRRHMTWVMIYAFVIGFIIAAYIHLTTYYQIGGDYAEHGGRAKLMNSGYLSVAQIMTGQVRKPNWGEGGAGIFGMLFAFLLVAARVRLVGFPLHPLGYAMATAYGHPIWGSALIVWAAKSLILRVGGIKLFRRYIPLFIGILIGHFFASGVVWGAVAVFNPEVTYNYVVFFG